MMSEEELEKRFTFHAPKGDQEARYLAMRAGIGGVAKLVVNLTPESREQSLALTALEEAVFWANAAIARRE